jgi:hypothetical protein
MIEVSLRVFHGHHSQGNRYALEVPQEPLGYHHSCLTAITRNRWSYMIASAVYDMTAYLSRSALEEQNWYYREIIETWQEEPDQLEISQPTGSRYKDEAVMGRLSNGDPPDQILQGEHTSASSNAANSQSPIHYSETE